MSDLAQATCESLPLASESVDLIFTDPPYPKEYLPCYQWLANEAMRVLKPGGFVLAMCGGSYLPTIYSYFEGSGLKYFYEMQHKSSGPAPIVYRDSRGAYGSYPLLARAKPIIAYSKGAGRPRVANISNLFETSNGWSEAKAYHAWGQDVNSARYFIEHFSKEGDLILDPFMGGGTTAVACELIGRRCIGFDVKFKEVKNAKERLTTSGIPQPIGLFA